MAASNISGSGLYLYHLTLQRPTAIVQAIYGNFTGQKQQEVIVARGSILELLRPDDSGKVLSVLTVGCFGVIRSLRPFRLTGGNVDHIVVGSDSGRIVILKYDEKTQDFEKVHQETYGSIARSEFKKVEYNTVW